jgi:NAD(P)H-dependent FMN reductase
MSTKTKVLGVCGSLRADSWNLKLLRNFLAALDTGPYSTRLYGSLEMPLMNQELESKPLDPRINAFRDAVAESQIVIFASPEYNASISGPLKNAIDWGTRGTGNVWQGKIGVLLAASPGALGGARGLIHLRTVLSGVKIWVIPEQVQCSNAPEAFDAGGALKNAGVEKQIHAAVESLGAFSQKLLE